MNTTNPYHSAFESPLGWIAVNGSTEALISIRFLEESPGASNRANALLEETKRQLEAYFAGELRAFDVPIAPQGSAFQQSVWAQLLKIPYGVLASYQDIADALGKPEAVRAVGAANGQNPIAIIVPCHRVVGKGGDLVGYGGGLWRKAWLLRHEGALLL